MRHIVGVEVLHQVPVHPEFHVEILGVVSLFGFLNRWNDSMATTLEEEPTEFANRTISGTGWTPGKHAAAE